MKVNGIEIKADQVWLMKNGNAVIIAKVNDSTTGCIKGYVHVSRDGWPGVCYWNSDGSCVADDMEDWQLIRRVTHSAPVESDDWIVQFAFGPKS